MSLQAVELHSAQEVRDHAKAVHARIQSSYGPPKIVLIQCELEATKGMLAAASLECDALRAENKQLRSKLEAATGHPDFSLNKCPTIDQIQQAVCKYFGITRIDLIAFRRTADDVYPRQVAMYLAKLMTVQSLPEIGRRFGKRDHTTVLHSIRKIDRERKTSADADSTVTNLKNIITAELHNG